MTDHFLRLKWEPKNEAELLDAYRLGRLGERNWCDLKADVALTKGENKELARDLASFAVDGGTLIIGLDEREPEGSPRAPVDLAKVTRERIESIALDIADPPLTVTCTVIAAEEKEGFGYVLVHVPASPFAVHQVDNKYLGRGDSRKVYLSDAQVVRLLRRREQWAEDAAGLLSEAVQADRCPGGRYPRLFIVARPISHDDELFRPVTIRPDHQRISDLITLATRRDTAINSLVAATHGMFALERVHRYSRTADGILLSWAEGGVAEDAQWVQELAVNESGIICYYDSKVGEIDNVNGVIRKSVLVEYVASSAREMLAVVGTLSREVGFAGRWQLGVHVEATTGTRPVRPADPRFYASSDYTAASYRQTTGANVAELIVYPGQITARLLGRLLRGYGTDRVPLAFEDPPASTS